MDNTPMAREPDPFRTLDHQPLTGDATLTVAPTTRTDLVPHAPAPQGYEILAEVGRGGMGVVYRAMQRSLNRVIALKVILGAGHSSEAQFQRFRAEATAVASLQHPNIVQVYETGEQDGQPFMALEYVEGGSLADFLHGEPQQPRWAAHMVRLLADAVQHAHERGIVHRDLKPGNILLACPSNARPDDPETFATTLKITDFGLAKQRGDTHLTATGAILGTPSYMAPEQAAGHGGEAGPPADVYALGAILYECLVGRPPFRSTTPMETVLQVLGTDPIPPRQLQPTVPHDLETIALKCLAKKPEQRYHQAADLAADLSRYLAGEPILARPVGRLTKAWKWAKRHPALAVVSFLFAVPLPILLAVMVFLFIDARAAHRATNLAREDEQKALVQAERDRENAQAYLKTTMATMDRILDRIGDQRVARIPEFQKDREAILNEGVDLYKALLHVNSTDPLVRFETAQTQNRVGKLFLLSGRSGQAASAAEESLRLLDALHQEFPEKPEYRHEQARALQIVSTAKVIDLDYQASLQLSERSAVICQELLAQDPDYLPYRVTACEAHRMMAMFHLIINPRRAQSDFIKALEQAEYAYAADPNSDEYRGLLALTLAMYSKYLVNSGVDRPKAVPMLERVQRLTALPAQQTKSIGYSREYLDSARVMARAAQGEMLLPSDPRNALPHLQAVVDDWEANIKGSPQSFPYRVQAVQAYQMLMHAHKSLKNHAEEIRIIERAVQLIDSVLADTPKATWLFQFRHRYQTERALIALAQQQRPEAVRLAYELDQAKVPAQASDAYNLACLLAILAGTAEGSERDELCTKALAWLKRSEATGYPATPATIAHVKKDADLNALRQLPEFNAWLEQLKPKGKN